MTRGTFDRADGVITLVEIKHHEGPFVLGPKDCEKLLEKNSLFVARTGTKNHVNLALLARDGVVENDCLRSLGCIGLSGDVLFEPGTGF